MIYWKNKHHYFNVNYFYITLKKFHSSSNVEMKSRERKEKNISFNCFFEKRPEDPSSCEDLSNCETDSDPVENPVDQKHVRLQSQLEHIERNHEDSNHHVHNDFLCLFLRNTGLCQSVTHVVCGCEEGQQHSRHAYRVSREWVLLSFVNEQPNGDHHQHREEHWVIEIDAQERKFHPSGHADVAVELTIFFLSSLHFLHLNVLLSFSLQTFNEPHKENWLIRVVKNRRLLSSFQ